MGEVREVRERKNRGRSRQRGLYTCVGVCVTLFFLNEHGGLCAEPTRMKSFVRRNIYSPIIPVQWAKYLVSRMCWRIKKGQEMMNIRLHIGRVVNSMGSKVVSVCAYNGEMVGILS